MDVLLTSAADALKSSF